MSDAPLRDMPGVLPSEWAPLQRLIQSRLMAPPADDEPADMFHARQAVLLELRDLIPEFAAAVTRGLSRLVR